MKEIIWEVSLIYFLIYFFPLNFKEISPAIRDSLCELSERLDRCVKTNSTQWRKSGLLIDSVDYKACKPILDGIDHVLTEHYGFTDGELDFIINYDIKYRMGRDAGEEGGKEED